MDKFESAKDCITHVREKTNRCILMLSYGKDSLVTLDMIHPYFDEVIGIFMFFVDGLEHIERWKRWCLARYPKLKIEHVPHWTLSYALRGGLYCVANPKQKLLKLRDVVQSVRIKYGIDYVFLGMKKADGMNRRLMIQRMQENHYESKGMCYPLADWTQKEVKAYMRMHDLPEPVLYGKGASNGLGFNADCFLWMREHFPDDLERIYATFPMSRRILQEYDIQQERKRLEAERLAAEQAEQEQTESSE